jgi:hypothetical protein
VSDEAQEPTEGEVALLEMEEDLRERIVIDPLALEREFVSCPSHIAHLGAVHGRAIRTHLRAKVRSKKTWGIVLIQAREDLEQQQEDAQRREDFKAAAEKRKARDVRERILKDQIESHAQQMGAWREAQEAEIDAEVVREVAKSNLAAMLAKKDMLVQLGANQRAEMERDPVIRDRRAVQRSQG